MSFVGDVWLASGQSNMNLDINTSDNTTAILNSATNNTIRFVEAKQTIAPGDQGLYPDWDLATDAGGLGEFSCVAFLTVQNLSQLYPGVPMGIIGCD